MAETGTSRICGGSRLPASIVSRIVRRPGIANRDNAYAAHALSASESTTPAAVTTRLLPRARTRPPPSKAVRNPSQEIETGNAPRPRAARSSNGRIATKTTNTTGLSHNSVSGIMPTCSHGERAGRGLRTGGRADRAVSVMSVLLRTCLAGQVRDDEADREHEDHDGDRGRVAEVPERERLLEHVRAQQLRHVVRPAPRHRPHDVEGAQR